MTATAQRTVARVLHLTAREFRIRYRAAVLGWLWAIAPPFVRPFVLAFVFTRVVPVGDDDYVALLAVGLLGWTWFSSGVSSAARSAVDRRELVAQPGLPREVVPLVSVLTGGVPTTAVLLPIALALQGCLILGVGMAASAADVRFRDARLAVDLALGVGFYATPVFYQLESVPERFRDLIGLNPVAQLLEAQRDLLVDGRIPDATTALATAAVCLGALALGWWVHARRSPTFLNDL